jgi:hypothetical protein
MTDAAAWKRDANERIKRMLGGMRPKRGQTMPHRRNEERKNKDEYE